MKKLSFEEFVWRQEWFEVVRLSQFVGESEILKMAKKRIREHKRGRELFAGPYGDRSEWAGMCRGWYQDYLENGDRG